MPLARLLRLHRARLAALLPWGEAGPLVLIAAAAPGVLELPASKVDATVLWPMQAAGARGVAQPAGDAARGRRAGARARRVVALRRLGKWRAAPPPCCTAPPLHASVSPHPRTALHLCTSLHLAPLHPATCTAASPHPRTAAPRQASGRSASERRPSGIPSSAGGAPSSARRRSAAQPQPPPSRRRWGPRHSIRASTQAPTQAPI